MIVHNDLIKIDLVWCNKKDRYPDIEFQLPYLLRLLNTQGVLPGQYQMRGFRGALEGRIWHAYIVIPKLKLSGRNGGRLMYYLPTQRDQEEDKKKKTIICYVGGHKHNTYENDKAIIGLITSRLEDGDTNSISLDEFLTKFTR